MVSSVANSIAQSGRFDEDKHGTAGLVIDKRICSHLVRDRESMAQEASPYGQEADAEGEFLWFVFGPIVHLPKHVVWSAMWGWWFHVRYL